MTYIIRPAKNEDSKDILDLIFNIWINEYQFQVSPEDYPDLHKIEDYYSSKGGGFWVASNTETVIGTIAYDQLDKNIFVLKRMFVSKEWRGQGIAQRLLDTLFDKTPKDCIFYLSTKDDLAKAAKKFYVKNGFEIIEQSDLPKNFPFFYEDDLFMKKQNCW